MALQERKTIRSIRSKIETNSKNESQKIKKRAFRKEVREWVLFAIQVIAIIVTLLLFVETSRQTQNSTAAIEIAEQTLKYSKEKDSKDEVEQRKNDAKIDANTNQSLKIASVNARAATKSADALTRSVDVQIKNFNTENDAILQISAFTVSVNFDEKKLLVEYILKNKGKQSAKILSDKHKVVITGLNPKRKDVMKSLEALEDASIVKNQNTVYIDSESLSFGNTFSLPMPALVSVSQYKSLVVLEGEITYVNSVTGVEKIYNYIVLLKVSAKSHQFWLNDNSKIEKA